MLILFQAHRFIDSSAKGDAKRKISKKGRDDECTQTFSNEHLPTTIFPGFLTFQWIQSTQWRIQMLQPERKWSKILIRISILTADRLCITDRHKKMDHTLIEWMYVYVQANLSNLQSFLDWSNVYSVPQRRQLIYLPARIGLSTPMMRGLAISQLIGRSTSFKSQRLER